MARSYKKTLITGGAGFIGSHLCELLLDLGQEVIAIDNLSTGCIANIEYLRSRPGFQFINESILNTKILDRLASQASLIIHLAATVGVKLIMEDPVHTIRTNITGTDAVLEAANRYACKVILASTSEVYGKGVAVPFQEDDDCLMGSTTKNRWAYAASKTVNEFMGLAYNQQFGLPVVILRFFNIIGPRQTGQYGMVVPRFVRAALHNEPLQIYGDGQQTRCFADVLDVIDAVVKLSNHPKAVGQVFNIGSMEEVTILALAERVIALTGSKSPIQMVPYKQVYTAGFEDMYRRVPSLEKTRQMIGYIPRYRLNDTLKRVIDYETNTV